MEHDLAGLLESGLVTLDLEQVRSLMKQLVQASNGHSLKHLS
jgi:hypothetical protein